MSAGFLVQALMLRAAEKLATGGNTLTARQMHAALGASHHIFFTTGLGRRLVTIHLSAIAPKYPVSNQQSHHEKNNFGQASRQMKM